MKLFAQVALFLVTAGALAADPQEQDFYKITTFTTPTDTAMEVGAIELLPDGFPKIRCANRQAGERRSRTNSTFHSGLSTQT